MDVLGQEGYRIRSDWGRRGARAAAERGDLVVICDVLSFSTAVAAAVSRGAVIHPCASREEADQAHRAHGAEIAVARASVPAEGRFSLSPVACDRAESGTVIALPSPNGATCCRVAADAPRVLLGALVNAAAVGAAVRHWLDEDESRAVTVIACGERYREDGAIRFAMEDLLGAGAVLSHLHGSASPEAHAARAAFLGLRGSLHPTLEESASGRELREGGFAEDVRFAARLDALAAVPELREDGGLR